MDPKIFITYSSKDQKVARTICTALENRGLACWISSRNIRPGQNYQEQIVRAIRAAKVMVLVFTANANNSNEIKKEIALASQNNLVVIPVRIEDVVPNEAFAYEFATRQWIDLFDNWENAVRDLVELIATIVEDASSRDQANAAPAPTPAPGSSGGAAAPAFFMAEPPSAPPPKSSLQQPAARWALVSGLAVIVAAVVAYAVVKVSQPPSPQPSTPTVIATAPTPTPPAAPQAVVTPSVPSTPPAPTRRSSAGALAVALPSDVTKSGFSYGYSNNNSDANQAEAKALDACRTTKDAAKDANLRSLCRVVESYSNECVAVAMDPAAGTPGFGWAVANDLKTAEQGAVAMCVKTAGPDRRAACVLDHSACDGNAH